MKKKTYDEVKDYIESYGYKLLSDNYINNSKRLYIKCPNEHIYKAKFNYFQQGNRCPYCANNIKYEYDEVKNYIESYGYKLLSDNYKNAHDIIKIKCPSGHIYETKFNYFQQGNRCPECIKNRKKTYNEVKNYIESYNYKLISGDHEYKNANSIIKVKCSQGHIYETRFTYFFNNRRCPHCAPNKKLTYNNVKKYINLCGEKLLSHNYINCNEKLLIECPNSHIYKVT